MSIVTLSYAQAQTIELSTIEAPTFTTTNLESELSAVETAEKLTEEQKTQAKTYLETAATSLANAAKNLESRARFITEFENASATLDDLRQSIESAQQEMLLKPERNDAPMGEEALLQLEQDLITKESEVRTLRSELEGYETGLQNLTARQITAPTELNEARTKLGEIVSSLTALGENGLDGVAEANRKSLVARQYFRRTQISALEQEIAGLSKRQEIVTARSNLTDLKLQTVSRDVQYLSEKTGQRRLNEALDVKEDAQSEQQSFANSHPLLAELAKQNLVLTNDIVDLASDAADISKKTANTISRLDSVEGDLRVANDFIKSGALDRRAGATLRRLSNQLMSLAFIKSQINETQKSRIGVTQKRLIAQEGLREIPVGLIKPEAIVTILRLSDVEVVNLTDTDRVNLQYLMNERSEYLQKIMNTASSRITETANLYEQQKALYESTEALKSLLDEKLLWVPSVPSIDTAWPAKVIKGVFKTFSPDNVRLAFDVFFQQIQSLWFLVFVFTIAIVSCVLARKHLWNDIHARSKDVGRVQRDNYWHTPAVILSSIVVALPIPLLLTLLWLLFELSISASPFIEGLAAMFICLAFLFLFLLTWRAWDKDHSLFASHYKLPDCLRRSVNKNLKWFIPLIGFSTAFIAVTESSTDSDVYEGFGLFAFVVTALALSYFALKVLWVDRKMIASNFGKDSLFERYKGIFTIICVGLPTIAAALALFGYYDTANQLLGRIFLSAWLLLLTYVVHGLIKRTVLIAQRQLAFKQAVEKRDAAAKARIEKLEAEERGEDIAPPPPVDTSEIDIKAMSRQSTQLLNTLIALAFATLIWVIWSDLLPALSVFNEVKIGEYTGQIIDDAGVIKDVPVPITLWNLIQSFVILALTFIAAKNLPGFLEIFVLNRAGVDAGSRYAITTILGYIIIAVGVVIGFDKLGLQWSQLRWIVTGLSVGIGFGLQKIIANFISGLIILFERPVRIGDYVTIGDQSGTVSRIQIRATTLADLENREILIPNEALISERVTNWTLSNSVTRVTVPVGIAYGSDTDKAREIMLESLKANPKVLETPAPQVLFIGFGDSSLDFELRVFLRNFDDRFPVRHMVHTDINKVLEKAGISIPFPQRDLNIVSQDSQASVKNKTTNRANKGSGQKNPKTS